jgi:3-hydroxyacyl-CoA dehydrogenase
MLATMKEVENFGLTFDVVDDLTGKKLGRASSGTFRTADVVGLDTMAHVIKTLQDNLSLETDPSTAASARRRAGQADRAGQPGPEDQGRLLQEGGPRHPALRARQRGLRARRPEGRRGLRPHAQEARRRAPEAAAQCRGAQGQFLWAILRNSFHYAAVHLEPLPTPRATWTRPCAGASA